tara:strand:+ start:3794 stop:4231 length:438 start_codon:yes stop_codon:yes gene_type:complete
MSLLNDIFGHTKATKEAVEQLTTFEAENATLRERVATLETEASSQSDVAKAANDSQASEIATLQASIATLTKSADDVPAVVEAAEVAGAVNALASQGVEPEVGATQQGSDTETSFEVYSKIEKISDRLAFMRSNRAEIVKTTPLK